MVPQGGKSEVGAGSSEVYGFEAGGGGSGEYEQFVTSLLGQSGVASVPREQMERVDGGGRDGGTVLLIKRCFLGTEQTEHTKRLLRKFFSSLVHCNPLPSRIILLDRAVCLCGERRDVLPSLRSLVERGSRVMVSAPCLDNLELRDKVEVGEVVSLIEIIDSLLRAQKVITI